MEDNKLSTEYVDQLFAAQVELYSEATAILFENQCISYRQLNTRANQLAHYLQKLGIGPDRLAAVYLERSPEAIISILAILKAGGAYLPLDPTYPPERIQFMLEDTRVPVIITTSALLEMLPENRARILCLDQEQAQIAQQPVDNPTNLVTEHKLAYVIYTSGSTGRPKGVMIEHRGLSNLALAQIEAFGIHAQSRVLQFASLNFDASVSEILTTLLAGATLCMARQEALLPGTELHNTLHKLGITMVTLPPAVLSHLSPEGLTALQTLISAGEACTADVITRWSVGRRFFNAYGPTEATVCATLVEISPESESLTIGRPIANTQIYILDADFQPVQDGAPGELFISGVGLGRGYLNRPELTAEKFIANPFCHFLESSPNTEKSDSPHSRLYRTGDIGKWTPAGEIELLGRNDQMVKLRGYRIELGEIEACLNLHPDVTQSAAMLQQDNFGNARLVAYLVARPRSAPSVNELRQHLLKTLPVYMVPSVFVVLDAMPLSLNGKIDRNALPAPTGQLAPVEAYLGPRTPLEKTLAEIWAEVLDISLVGINDNFFDMGGHSLLATLILTRVRAVLQIDVPLSILFTTHSTIAEMAQAIEQYQIETAQPDELAELLAQMEGLTDEEVQKLLLEMEA